MSQPTEHHIEIASILSARTKQGMVEMTINRAGEDTTKIQMELGKAREILAMLSGAIEAAVSDQLLYQFLTERVGLDAERMAAVLLDFRELRQGSRGTVYPQ